MKTLTQQLQTSSTRSRIFRAALTGIIVSFVLYGFAIANTTLSIADADTYNNEVNELQTEIAELEVHYFDIINELSITEAQESGFTEVSSVRYAHINKNTSVAYNL